MATFNLKELRERTLARTTQEHEAFVERGGWDRIREESEQERLARVALGEETEDGESLIVSDDDEDEFDPDAVEEF